ncbi:MAG TPA: cupin domain-containing protein [Rhizomicrobium sp.]|nr:cupin domain-containing protein [Rhizomicrobium sp.]
MDTRRRFCAVFAALLLTAGASGIAEATEPMSVVPLLHEKLSNAPGQSIVSLKLTMQPGATSGPHHHAGFMYAYMLSGTVRSQLKGEAPRTLAAGDTLVEPPGSEHLSFTNSGNVPAELLVVWVAPDGAALTVPEH